MPEGTENDPTYLASLREEQAFAEKPAGADRPPSERPAKTGCGGCGSGGGGCGSRNGASAASAAAAAAASAVPANTTEPPLSSGDMARGCETTIRTVRFYEEAGLIEPVARSEGGHRVYHPEQLLKLQLIMDLREAGLSLQDIRALFELKHRFSDPEAASKQMAEALEAQIACMQRKISVLRRLREELASMVATIRECEQCDAPDFKQQCDGCDVMNRADLPRAMRLLWGSRE